MDFCSPSLLSSLLPALLGSEDEREDAGAAVHTPHVGKGDRRRGTREDNDMKERHDDKYNRPTDRPTDLATPFDAPLSVCLGGAAVDGQPADATTRSPALFGVKAWNWIDVDGKGSATTATERRFHIRLAPILSLPFGKINIASSCYRAATPPPRPPPRPPRTKAAA